MSWSSLWNWLPGLQIHVACCGADHLTFEVGRGRGGVWYGWFPKKISCRLISREKIIARKHLWGKKISYTEKKCYTFACQRKIYHQRFGKTNFYPIQITRTPLKSQIIARLLIQPSVLAPRHYGHFDRRKVPGGEERGEVDVLAG